MSFVVSIDKQILKLTVSGLAGLIGFWYFGSYMRKPKAIAAKPLAYVIYVTEELNEDQMLAHVEQIKQKIYKKILLHINSPGGSAIEYFKMYYMIRDCIEIDFKDHDKPDFITYVDKIGCSAGYMLAVIGKKIYCAPYGQTGSIGAIGSGFVIDPKWMDYIPIKPINVSTSSHKIGAYDILFGKTDAEKEIRPDVTLIYEHFTQIVRSRRPDIADEAVNGNSFHASKALELKLIDEIATEKQMWQKEFADFDVRCIPKPKVNNPYFSFSISFPAFQAWLNDK